MRTCEVEGCEAAHLAKGLCRNHYYRQQRNGHPGLQDRSPKPCSVEGCETKAKSLGLCGRHYQQRKAHGQVQSDRLPFADLFWSRVDKRDDQECWPWTGTASNGYGYLKRDRQSISAHRVAYELTFGPVPDGKELDHTCHEPQTCIGGSACLHRRCCNPRHLVAVLHSENCAPDRTVLGFHQHERKRRGTRDEGSG